MDYGCDRLVVSQLDGVLESVTKCHEGKKGQPNVTWFFLTWNYWIKNANFGNKLGRLKYNQMCHEKFKI